MKDIRFCGRSLDVLRGFPAGAKREAGYQLDRIQRGLEPTDWKPMPSIGSGVREIRIMEREQYRVIYVAKFADAVYVLHAFQKKTQKTRKQDIDAAKQAFKKLLTRYE
ncbi:MAG: type II toxin-antitoxin system RelE/ParE family toxin [Gammaproteobacteria bacterium]|nr:MAG: type II toxin-antitoxin system RelE/ParE family toxin [Gammaproteobacteria bacterium]